MSKRTVPIEDENVTPKGEPEEPASQEEDGAPQAAGVDERVAALEAENQQLKDRVLRTIAELENFRRRSHHERQQTVEYANEHLLRQLLPMIDDFERALEAGTKSRDFESFFDGVELVHANIGKLFERLGVRLIDAVGKPFDVNFHEAILRQPSDAPEDTVILVVEQGYIYHDRVLRHSKVIVSAGT